MKKLLIFILFFAYLATTTGTSINMHYCMGKLAETSLYQQQEDKKCSKCGMVKKKTTKKGCCKDEHKWVKITDDQKSNTSFAYQFIAFETDLHFINAFQYTLLNNQSVIDLLPPTNAPPPSLGVEVYKRNCVFLI